MRVYHFLEGEYGLEALRHQRLKLAEIMELNDSFEFLCADLSDEYCRIVFNANKLRLSKKHGLLCFSKNWNNPVQWAHYTDRHKGLCLGFDVEDQYLKEVCYLEGRIECPKTDKEGDAEFEKKLTDLTDKLIAAKHSHWKYEKEHRLFEPKKDIPKKNKINGLYFYNFSKALELKEIIIGERSKITRSDISKALGSNKSNIRIFNAYPSFTKYKMERRQNDE